MTPTVHPPRVTTSLDLATLFTHLPDAVYLIDPVSSNILWANRMAWECLGLGPDDVLNHSVLSLQKDVVGLPQWTDIAQVIRRSPQGFRFIGRHLHAAGHEIAVEVLTSCFWLDGQERFLSVARDVTNRVIAEGSEDRRDKQLWFALNEASDGLWDWDVPSGTLFFSPQLKRMLGYGPDEMAPVLSTWTDNVHPDDAPRVMAVLQEHMAGKRTRYEAEYRLRNRNGHYLWVSDRGRVCDRAADGTATRIVGMVHDISEHKLLEQRLLTQASHDTLTGLPNRRQGSDFFESQLELCRRMGLPLGVAFVDVDNFKQINDTHGHGVGDTVIQRLGEILRGSTRASDMVCRWGGDEFIVVCPNTDETQMQTLTEKLCEAVVVGLSDSSPSPTISIGYANFPQDGPDMGRLLARADAALYRAKSLGRNRVAASRAPAVV